MKKEFPEEDEILLGTVTRLIGTSVFIHLDHYDKEGVISFSEVSSGRIHSIRDYVRIGQKIVCKVLRVDESTGHIDLSLRRVTTREKKKMMEANKREKDALTMISIAVKDKERLEKIAEDMKKEFDFSELVEQLLVLTRSEILTKLKKLSFSEAEAERFLSLIAEKVKSKRVNVKTRVSLFSEAADGIERIKKILTEIEKEAKIIYISTPYYSISVESDNYKEANKKLKEITDRIESRAKELDCVFELRKEK